MKLAILTTFLFLMSGCVSHNTTEFYLKYNKETGVAKGYANVNGEVTKIIIEPELRQ